MKKKMKDRYSHVCAKSNELFSKPFRLVSSQTLSPFKQNVDTRVPDHFEMHPELLDLNPTWIEFRVCISVAPSWLDFWYTF